jgi:hypothetical protein
MQDSGLFVGRNRCFEVSGKIYPVSTFERFAATRRYRTGLNAQVPSLKLATNELVMMTKGVDINPVDANLERWRAIAMTPSGDLGSR